MRRVEWLLIALIVAAGVFLRLYRLDAIPPGMTHDEADVGYHAAAVYATGQRHIVDQPYGFINQPLVQYSGALFMRIFGPTDLAQRLHSAFFGVLLIAATYAWTRLAFDASIALTASTLMAVGFWPVMTSRFALNNQPVPAIFTIGILLLWSALFTPVPSRAAASGRSLLALLGGLFLGLSVYPYEAGRAVLASLPVFGLYLWLLTRLEPRASKGLSEQLLDSPPRHHPLKRTGGTTDHQDSLGVSWRLGVLVVSSRNRRPGSAVFLIALAAALIVAAPHLLDPRSWGRTGTLVSETVGAGGATSLVDAVIQGLGTLFVRGDPFVTYNIPDRPVFDPILAVLFAAGLVVAIRKWRTPAYGYTLIWLVFGLAPTLVVGAFTSTIHSIAAQTPVFVLLAIGAAAIARLVARRQPRLTKILLGAAVVYSAVVTVTDYFGRWADTPEVRAAYHNYFVSMIDEVDARADADVALSSAFPDKPLDPFIAARRLRRPDVILRHFNATRALVFPDADSGLLIVPALTPIDPALAARLDLPAPETITARPNDLIPSFDVYRWNPRTISNQLISQLTPVAAIFGGAVELMAATIHSPQLPSTREGVVLTVWRVLDPEALGPVDATKYDRQAVLFTHVVDAEGSIVAQDDRLDAPVSSWQVGDTFVQVHRFVLKSEVAPGTYRVLVGVYTLPAQTRLPAASGGDTVAIGEIEVGRLP